MGQGLYNIDEPTSIERMSPAHYLIAAYYEHWLAGLERLLVEKGRRPAEIETKVREFASAAPPAFPNAPIRRSRSASPRRFHGAPTSRGKGALACQRTRSCAG
jgi:hypothetical protein